MIWTVEPKGDGMVMINGNYLQPLDSFVQCLNDEDQRINKRGMKFAYKNE